MNISQPPSSFTGPLAEWARTITNIIQGIPQFSYGTHPTPEGIINGSTGDFYVAQPSTSTLTCLWTKSSAPGLVSTTSWVKIGVVP